MRLYLKILNFKMSGTFVLKICGDIQGESKKWDLSSVQLLVL